MSGKKPNVDQIEDLKGAINDFLCFYEKNRGKILEAVNKEGGLPAVMEMEDIRNHLHDTYYTLVKAQLDANHPKYSTLVSQAANLVEEIQKSIEKVKKIEATVQAANSFVATIGKILTICSL